MNSNITAEELSEARDWASDCLGLVGVKVTAERAVRYVRRHYPGGWNAFAVECCNAKWRVTVHGTYGTLTYETDILPKDCAEHFGAQYVIECVSKGL
ncbi:hypothetical protein ACFPM3_20165 [Streptomyces coeruleoprunus]|uniref:Phage protein n=1 Tax=Streptomyces coeruleoprunus TaxID=285563 RepID=A0ABV9XHJ0_9ACTN